MPSWISRGTVIHSNRGDSEAQKKSVDDLDVNVCRQKLLCTFPDSPETVVLNVLYMHLFVSLRILFGTLLEMQFVHSYRRISWHNKWVVERDRRLLQKWILRSWSYRGHHRKKDLIQAGLKREHAEVIQVSSCSATCEKNKKKPLMPHDCKHLISDQNNGTVLN